MRRRRDSKMTNEVGGGDPDMSTDPLAKVQAALDFWESRHVGPRNDDCASCQAIAQARNAMAELGALLGQRERDTQRLEAEVVSLRAFKRNVEEALNSGDGVY